MSFWQSSNSEKKLAKKKIGHPATAWIQAGTRCTIPEKLSHFNRVQTQKKKSAKKKIGHPATAWIQAGTRCPIPGKLSAQFKL